MLASVMKACPDPIFTNVLVFRDIALEALTAAEASLAERRRSKEGGEPGFILSPDPDQMSFKQSLVAIVFAGMFIEAVLWLAGTKKLGVEAYTPIDKKPLEQRLAGLEIEDERIAARLEAYRKARKELVHEKPLPISIDRRPLLTAQEEAKKAVELMSDLERVITTRGLKWR